MNTNDEMYIANVQSQIDQGTYDHLFFGKSNLVFLDIGANTGLVSEFAVQFCRRIVALEPAPNVFPMLESNTRFESKIECVEVALAAHDGEEPFYINDINFTASSTVNTYGIRTTVQGRKLSTILRENNLTHIDICKIDCEGCEGESLSYPELENAKPIIQTYYIETHNCPNSTWETKLSELVKKFSLLGYHKMQIDGMALTATQP